MVSWAISTTDDPGASRTRAGITSTPSIPSTRYPTTSASSSWEVRHVVLLYFTAEARAGQVAAWSEQIDETNLEQIFWPRAAAAAEVFWTGQAKERDANEALPRLHDLRERMRRRGVKAVPLQPFWCALRPGECDAL